MGFAMLTTFVQWCIDQVGAPVLMGSKGDYWVRPSDEAVVKWPAGLFVYDCSGLVTCGIKACGGPDLRDTHNAQKLWDEAPEVELQADEDATFDPLIGALGFYGADYKHVDHVVIGAAGGHIISADGATIHIQSLADAKAAGAQVRVHQPQGTRLATQYRLDVQFLGFRPNRYLLGD